MKKLFIISAIVGIVALTSNQSNAQVSINVNIGAQPAWVPVGYENVNYYYLPEVQSYYYVPQRQFVYLSGNNWVRSRYLPSRYRGYNLHHGRKVVVYGNTPFHSYRTHNARYSSNNTHFVRPSYGNYQSVKYNSHNNHKSYKHFDSRGGGRGHFDRGHGKGRH